MKTNIIGQSSIQDLGTAGGEQLTLDPQRYSVDSKLGEGGMGDVYRITDKALGRSVAVKTLKPELLQDQVQSTRFRQEARVTGRLEHPGIPPVHDLGTDQSGHQFFTMKLVKGQNLASIIEQLRNKDPEVHRRFSFDYRAQVMISLCQAVEFANSQGVFHRDIKPENIMLGEHGEVQLMDWGIAYDTTQPDQIPDESDFIGTVTYASPERFQNREAAWTTQSEVFSIGAVMYELFTLAPAYQGKTVLEVITKIMNDRPVAPLQVRTPAQRSCPVEYSYIISSAMAKDPQSRIPTAKHLSQRLQMALQNEAPVVCPCTAVKFNLHLLDQIVDRAGGLGALFVFGWFLSPLLLVVLLLIQNSAASHLP